MTFQAGLVVFETPFIMEGENDEPEALEMEHFIFPIGLWLAGLVLSTLCLLIEIIIQRCGNQE